MPIVKRSKQKPCFSVCSTDEFNGLIRTSILIDEKGIVVETSQANDAATHLADMLTYLLTTTTKSSLPAPH